jgi:integrase
MRGSGTVVKDNRSKKWMFLWWEDGKRKSKSLGQQPNKTAAWRSAKPYRDALENQPESAKPLPDEQESEFKQSASEAQCETEKQAVLTVNRLIAGYRVEKMPKRQDTRRSYELWFKNHIIPKWGDGSLFDVQARPVELWMASLDLSPKSKSHIRGLLSTIWEYAMWSGEVPTQRNPLELVSVPGASKRKRKPRSLTVEEFQTWVPYLQGPMKTIALTCVAFGLRISEGLALKWRDIDWLRGRLTVERGIVRQIVDEVKTENSDTAMNIAPELLDVLTKWKQVTDFAGADDWIFASPVSIGRLPYSYTGVLHAFQKAAVKAGIGVIGTHSMRHTYRSWLDAVGTTIAVQQKMMRHADIRTTMKYGDVVTDEMALASGKVAALAFGNGL